jgi:NitT/TauT family transport system permease protein
MTEGTFKEGAVNESTSPVLAGEDELRHTFSGQIRARVWAPPLIALLVLGVAWQLYAVHNPYVLPKVQEIFGAIWDNPGLFWDNALVTLREVAVGAMFGMCGALVLAILMVEVDVIERALMPLAVILNVTPIVAIAPGLVVAFGFGTLPKYLVTAIIVFFPFLVNALAGLRSVDPLATEFVATLHAGRTEVLWRLRLPSSLPFLFAGARICLPLAVIGAVVAEFSAAGNLAGLGSLIIVSAQQADLKTIYASVLILAVIGVLLTVVVLVLESRFLKWHVAGHGASGS